MSDMFTGVLMICLFVIMFLMIYGVSKAQRLEKAYDERQELVIGKGYKYGFYTILIAGFFYMISLFLDLKIMVETQFIILTILLAGVLVHSIYCIFNDAFIQVNQKPKGAVILWVFILLINAASLILNMSETEIIVNGKINGIFYSNALILVFYSFIMIAMIINLEKNKKGVADEES